METMQIPGPFLNQMREQLKEDFSAFLQALEETPPVSVRNNPFKPALVFDQHEPVPWEPMGRYLPERPVFTLDPLFHAGSYYVQEASSMFAGELLRRTADLSVPLCVLDMCAAPGGKSTQLASLLTPDSLLVANEVIRSRVAALQVNLEKWGVSNFCITNHDPADFSPLSGFFDIILVDAPCSGEGLFRKDPAAMKEWSEENRQICSDRQKRILGEVTDLLREGGLLLYSTCTFNRLENDLNIRDLCANGGFEVRRPDLPVEWGITVTDYGYQFYPHRLKGEGFYISVLQKTSRSRERRSLQQTGIKDWRSLSKKDKAMLEEWVDRPDNFHFYEKPKGDIVFVPEAVRQAVETVAAALRRRSVGRTAGQRKRDLFIPGHGLALSPAVGKSLPTMDLGLEDALRFLKKEDVQTGASAKGWHLVRYRETGIGWAKVLENRINNYLPREWRIRMDIGR